MIKWILDLLILSTSVFLVTHILPSVTIKNFTTAVLVALVYGILKTLLTGILVFLTLPAMILSLGLFLFVINAFLLSITNLLIKNFEVKGCFSTVVAAFLITVIDVLLHWLIPGV
jgi:putative membrane protein